MAPDDSRSEGEDLLDVFSDAGVLRRVLDDEVIGKELLVVGPTVDVLLEADGDEFLEGLGEFAGRQWWRVFSDHLLELLERRPPSGVRELSGGHLDQADAQRPHVASDVIVGYAGALRVDPKIEIRQTITSHIIRATHLSGAMYGLHPASMVFATESTK